MLGETERQRKEILKGKRQRGQGEREGWEHVQKTSSWQFLLTCFKTFYVLTSIQYVACHICTILLQYYK